MFKNINEINVKARKSTPVRLAVAAAEDITVLEAIRTAHLDGIIEPILIGNGEQIREILKSIDYQFEGRIVSINKHEDAASKTMELIKEDQADLPMKGLISTKNILKALLADEYGLRQQKLLSLITLLYLKKEDRIILITDAGMNIAPDLEKKIEIINNAVEVARILGIEKPGVAPLAAVEKVNPAMPVTIEAAILSKMAERGQIKNAVIDGPLALDNALSLEAAAHKGIDSPVAGKADILLVPDIEAGNILYKALVFYAGLPSASIVFGAKVPLVITSRADASEVKYNSIALAKVVLEGIRKN